MVDILKVGSLFSGIGAFEKALKGQDINYDVEYFCEIDKHASKSYCAIHNELETKNLSDVTKIDINALPYVDLLTHGSPCQSFSVAGLQKGGDIGSGTTSSLMWYSVEIIKNKLPKYVVWENVKNVLSKRHKHNFDAYLESLESFGYNNYFQILNAKDFGIPQNRERVFVVSIRKDVDKGFEFPIGCKSSNLKDFLDPRNDVDFTNGIDNKLVNRVIYPVFVREYGDIIKSDKNVYYCNVTSGFQDANIGISHSPTIRTSGVCPCVLIDDKIIQITPKEAMRLTGFNDIDYHKCINAGVSEHQIKRQSGNSIVVNVLEEIFKNLLKGIDQWN